MFYSLLLNSLVVSKDLALSIQHPFTNYLSKIKRNKKLLKLLCKTNPNNNSFSAHTTDNKNVNKDPRDRIDANCTFTPKLIARPIVKKRNKYEQKAARVLESSRRKVLGIGIGSGLPMTIQKSLSKSQKELDIKRRNRIVQQVSNEASLNLSTFEEQQSTLTELNDGAKAIQSVFRRRKAQEQVHSMKNNKKEQEEKEKSAIKMQAVIRGRAKRKGKNSM